MNHCTINLLHSIVIRRGIEVSRKKSLPPIEEEDVDVARERQRIMLGGNSDDVLKIEELTKVQTLFLVIIPSILG